MEIFFTTIILICVKMSSSDIMNILYCGDNGIAQGVLVSIFSILKYNKEPIHFFIATIEFRDTKPFSEKSAKFLDSLVKKTNPKSFVKLIDATDAFIEGLPKKNMGALFFPPAAMLRLYIDKMPELTKLSRVLYLDYDVVCRGDLREFYDTDLDEIEAAGVLDMYGRRFYKYHGIAKRKNDRYLVDMREKKELSFLKQDYMNSGVMLFNIPECLKSDIFPRAVDLCIKRWSLLADQAALNKVINKRKLCPRRFNEQSERPKKDTILHHFSNNFKFFPYIRLQKVKPFEVDKVHEILKITEYDDILEKYKKMEKYL